MQPTDRSSKKQPAGQKAERPNDAGSTGAALRKVYQRAVEEEIPAEMLDLLNKLT
ncbi:NepR family anti-sigma factor [Sphingomonas sp. GlSt437]|uniref:NepR family anti-sigma factor n=1 Tax=Sphingomonas sp. GlSt437 TaxID=3389970 RepID=UPI003A843E9A